MNATTPLLIACLAVWMPSAALSQSSATSSRPSPRVPVLNWTPCGGDFPGAECATARVPLDYDEPRGATTEIALAKIPAANPARKIGTVFLNPGGPGGSGTDLLLFGFGDFVAQQLEGRFDVIGFDPRGIAFSEPIRCFATEDSRAAFFAEVPFFPYQAGQKRPFFDVYRAFGRRCIDRKQRITAHMSTADVVRDLDLLRQAVGDQRLSYLGFSYGSYIGNTYANLFPDKVRALVIDGVLDPRLWSSGWQVRSDRVATAEEFDEFLRLCDEAGDDCDLSAPGGAAERFDALAAALRDEPLLFPDGSLYTYDFLIADAASAMYTPEFWGGPDGYAAFFAALADAVLGDAQATKAAVTRAAIQVRLNEAAPHRADYDNSFDGYYGNQCADTEYPNSFPEFRAIGTYAEAGSVFGPYWWWGNSGCADWPVAKDRYIGPWTARTSAPVLVVGNFFDGVTDYAGAVASSRLLKNSRLLSYAGWGHTAFGRSDCVTAHVVTYLLSGKLPGAGTVCPANPNPFVVATAALRSTRAPPLIGLPTALPARR